MAEFPAHLFRMDGEPSAIRASAMKWSAFGTAAEDASAQITTLDTGEFVGPEGDMFRDGLDAEMPKHLQITGTAFTTVSDALLAFASTLGSLQDQMRPLAQQAPALWQAVQNAQARVSRAHEADEQHARDRAQTVSQAEDAGETAPPDTYSSDSGGAGAALSAAQRAWDDCVSQANGLRTSMTSAVSTCVEEIKTAKGMRFKENPKWWDIGGHFTNFVRDHKDLLQKLSGALKIVSVVAGLLSFIPVLAPITAPIAIGAGLAAAAIDLSVYGATGEGSLTQIAIDVGLMVLPGVGRLASGAIRAGAPQLMARTSYLVRNSRAYQAASAFGNTRVGHFVTAPGRMLDRANTYVATQLGRTRAGQAIVNLSERSAARAEQSFVSSRLDAAPESRAATQAYRDSLQQGPIRNTNPDARAFQEHATGPREFNLQHAGDDLGYQTQWADNIEPQHAAIEDAKYTRSSDHGYYGNESSMIERNPDGWQRVHDSNVREFERYAARIDSPNNPLETLVVRTNDPGSVEYFADIMNEAGVRGVVVVVPWR